MAFSSDEVLRNLAVSLSAIDQPQKTWLAIGDALHELEERNSKGTDGRPWHEVLRSFLETQGQSVTTGHLNKVRRVTKFVRDNAGPDVSDEDLIAAQVQFSALEMAERLNTLDRQAGVEALHDCISGLTFGKMRARYEGFREAHPDLLPPRQLAWMRKRSSPGADSQSTYAVSEVSKPSSLSELSDSARLLSEQFAEQFWRKAYERGYADAGAILLEKERMIDDLRVRIATLEREVERRMEE